MKVFLSQLDPVDEWAVEAAVTHPVFAELFGAIIGDEEIEAVAEPLQSSPSSSGRPSRRRTVVFVVVLILVGGFVGIRGLGGARVLTHPITTGWHEAQALDSGSSGRNGSWQLVDAVMSGTWQQNEDGPPPGYLTCATPGRCYVMAGNYSSAAFGSPLLSESLYVTIDQGANWAVLPMPTGFAATTALSCSGAGWCAAGGTYHGQPILLSTTDGGHSFTMTPVPSGLGTIDVLACPSLGACDALVATSTGQNDGPIGATFLAMTGGGAKFVDHPILAGDSMVALACVSSTRCTVVGATSRTRGSLLPTGVAALTNNGGKTWTPGSIPIGFGIQRMSSPLVCTDATHCVLGGEIPIRDANTCAGIPTVGPSLTSFSLAPSVRAISRTESRIAEDWATQSGSFQGARTCTNARTSVVSAFATSTDGGLTWNPQSLPSDVPSPQIDGLACSSTTACWASGSESVPQKIAKVTDFGSSVLLGTVNGGQSWSKVIFHVPASAPNPQGQSYQSIGAVSCPTSSLCLAAGVAAQGASVSPIYRLVIPHYQPLGLG
ncbi:hypothetical protein [Ferrimicrobium sp.]|uniref:hypothetical protein n=1 Tax=Ferrimicrobium sp. TaxID=2926050 RepID=UPI0026064121|nr:hypothetical protein [Ferrimicrobium sp.]